jgi:hypothetical protein
MFKPGSVVVDGCSVVQHLQDVRVWRERFTDFGELFDDEGLADDGVEASSGAARA